METTPARKSRGPFWFATLANSATSHRLITILFASLLVLQSVMSAASPCPMTGSEHASMMPGMSDNRPAQPLRADAGVETDNRHDEAHAGHDMLYTAGHHGAGQISEHGLAQSLEHASAVDAAANSCCDGGYCSQSGCTMPALAGLPSELAVFSIAAPYQQLRASIAPLAAPDSPYRPPSA
jgi:hypothetical protein